MEIFFTVGSQKQSPASEGSERRGDGEGGERVQGVTRLADQHADQQICAMSSAASSSHGWIEARKGRALNEVAIS